MAVVSCTAEELDKLPSETNWERLNARTEEQIEALADEDELDEGYDIAVDYELNADDTLTEKASGRTFTRVELLAELAAARAREGQRDAAE